MRKQILILILLQAIIFSSIAQTKVTIPFYRTKSGLINVNVKINDYKKIFIFDTGASGVVISSDFFMEMLNKGYVNKSDIVGKTSVVVADGSVQDAFIAQVKTVDIGGFYISDALILVMPDPNAPLLIGQDVLSAFGKVTIDNDLNVIDLEESSNIYQSSVLQLKELKYIPCSISKISEVPNLKSIIGNDVRVLSVTEEQNVPPPAKAVANITAEITIRYFDNDDYNVAVYLKKKIQQSSDYRGADIKIQNMLPFFNYKAITGLVEIWIK